MSEDASNVENEVVNNGDSGSPSAGVSGLEATVEGLRGQVQAMQEMHGRSMQNMMAAMNNARHPLDATPATPPVPDLVRGMDPDDPYYEQFKELANQVGSGNGQVNSQVQRLQQQLYQMQLANSRSNIESSVSQALESHKVPTELADKVRTIAYAAMAESGNNGHGVPSADSLVSEFMQSLGTYAEKARVDWAKEAKRPKPISMAAASAGIPDEKPKSWEEAKERSIALMQAMVN
tara:strand:- start:1153 stop:1857 length:705 start_codon:yes stop_codon:yes gene_type:complete